ncbi:MAG: hypothetical protein KTR31_00245 [Myxococcales bacterium]|nr:hypothetical protein [Myxococcales bacterium]
MGRSWIRWCVVASCAACGGGEGELLVQTWGEEAGVNGFNIVDEDAFFVGIDEWVTTVGGFRLTDPETGEVVAEDTETYLLDLTRTVEPEEAIRFPVPVGRQRFGFANLVPETDAVRVTPVGVETLNRMAINGYTHWIEGLGSNGKETVRFSFGLTKPTRYEGCENGADGSDGVEIVKNEVRPIEITVHPDHLLSPRLGVEPDAISFRLLADVGEDDGFVDNADLEALVAQNVAPAYADRVQTLLDFLSVSMSEGMHVNGRGLCVVDNL